jgi:hypothetical protein
LTDLGLRVLDASRHIDKRDNAILRVADVVDVIAEVIEVLGKGRREPSHAVMPTVGGAVQPTINRAPDDSGREERERSVDSFRAKVWNAFRTISTFSCDTAYPLDSARRSAAARASSMS